jgi:hypothetical protein
MQTRKSIPVFTLFPGRYRNLVERFSASARTFEP